ncbi:MAG TPA: hypothetical protein VK459_12350 [Polyangiaceae bacterium]|jgi:hypothetical protein|nr:hypothetical protein [Polyangiaceae bacterium]
MSTENDLKDVTFECSLAEEAGGIRLKYEIKNGAGRDVVVFNRLPTKEVDDTHRYSPNNVYVDLEGARVEIKQMILPLILPPGVKLEYHPLPDVSVLKAGESLREEIFVPQPISVRNPIRLAGMAGTLTFDTNKPTRHVTAMKPVTASELSFSVGVSAFAPASKLKAVSEVYPNVFMPPLLEGAQKVISKSFHLAKPVKVLDYAVSE